VLAISKDPDAVRAALAAAKKPVQLTEPQIRFARTLFKRHPTHPVVKRLTDEKRGPTISEFDELVNFDKESTGGRVAGLQPEAAPGQFNVEKQKQKTA
jgi:hypothetical protein